MSGYSVFGRLSPELVEEMREQVVRKKAVEEVRAEITYPAPPNELIFAYAVDHGGSHVSLLRGSYTGILKEFPEFGKVIQLFGARADRVETKHGIYERNKNRRLAQLISGEEFNRLAELDVERGDNNPVIYEVYEREPQEKD